jgi:hypothetical protein
MPDYKALCDFCDVELAGQCSHAGSEECPHQEIYDFPTAVKI